MKEWQEIPTPRNLYEFYYQYQLPLARAFFQIERRGVAVDPDRLEELRNFLMVSLEDLAVEMSEELHKNVAFSKAHALRMGWGRKDYINLAYPGDIANLLKSRGLKLPRNRLTGQETTAEDAMNQIYADTGDEITMKVLHAREYTKILGTYVNARLHNNILYSSYRIVGTVTGRRSASKNVFGYGTNHQNLPKHSELGHRFRHCVRARDGKILVSCDQSQAEDWLVSGLIGDIGGDFRGLDELRARVDRHRRLGAKLFDIPEDQCGKNTPERFMGKKVRHAGNYDMGPDEFARQLVKEGHPGFPPALCAQLLEIFHGENSGIRLIFHKWVQDRLSADRTLVTPLGRERIFLGARPFSDNKKVYKEAYAQIPQSTVGDNTGMAVLYCEHNDPGFVVMDAHDAVTLEVDDQLESVEHGVRLLDSAFDRTLCLPNGLPIKIPVEFEIGYNLGEMEEFKDVYHVMTAYEKVANAKATA